MVFRIDDLKATTKIRRFDENEKTMPQDEGTKEAPFRRLSEYPRTNECALRDRLFMQKFVS